MLIAIGTSAVLSTLYAIYCNYTYHRIGDRCYISNKDVNKMRKLDIHCDVFFLLSSVLCILGLILYNINM